LTRACTSHVIQTRGVETLVLRTHSWRTHARAEYSTTRNACAFAGMYSAMHPTTHGRHIHAVLTDCQHSVTVTARLSVLTTPGPAHPPGCQRRSLPLIRALADTARGKSTHSRPHARTSPSLLHARQRTDCCTADLLHSNTAPFIHTSNWLHCISQALPDPRQRHAALQLLNFNREPLLPCSYTGFNSSNLVRCLAASFTQPLHLTLPCSCI